MKRKWIPSLLVLLALCIQRTALSAENPNHKTIVNVDGTEITVPVEVRKIGCLFGPSYEKVVLLDAEDKIVFDGDFHIYS